MEFDKLLDNCQALEKTISILVKSNSQKQAKITQLHSSVLENAQSSLDELLEDERKFQDQLDSLKYKKIDLDTKIKQYSDINEKLSELVAIAQNSDCPDNEADDCKNDIHSIINDALAEYEQVKLEYTRIVNKVEHLSTCLIKDSDEIKDLIKQNQGLVVDTQRNDSIMRLLEQQSKYAEQQFDLILNQLPWKPLTEFYLDELKKSPDQAVRDLAENLHLQKNEIEDLNESLKDKMKKKLQVLEELHTELNDFVQKRDEAVLVTRFIE